MAEDQNNIKQSCSDDYSDSTFTGNMQTIYLNGCINEIVNSTFKSINLTNDEEYLFVVQKEFSFLDVIFDFNDFGSIKIETSKKVTISNCVFIGCSVSNGRGNAICLGTSEDSNDINNFIIENCLFESCGDKGWAVEVDCATLFQNNNVSYCGVIHILKCRAIITQCLFTNITSNEIIEYESTIVATSNDFFHIEKSMFFKCVGKCCYFNIFYSGSSEYISITNCSFEECYNSNYLNDFVIGVNEYTDSISLNIINNVFSNCGINDEDIFIILLKTYPPNNQKKSIIIENNLFNHSSVSIFISQENEYAIIHNCTFSNVKSNSIILDYLSNILIEDCIFEDNYNGSFIDIQSNVINARIHNCSFRFVNSFGTSPVIVSSIINIAIDTNYFIRCGKNTINIDANNQAAVDSQFYFNNNHFKDQIDLPIVSVINKIHSNPVINSNIYENLETEDNTSYLFNLEIDDTCSLITFQNDTFKNITTPNGGFGSRIYNSNDQSINLTFSNCLFIENIQKHDGGAFYSSNKLNNGKIFLSFIECFFEDNVGENTGGALSASSFEQLIVENCSFIYNSLYNNTGNGGAIYVGSLQLKNYPIIIEKCSFLDNTAEYGYSIYIEESSIPLLVTDCIFNSTIEAGKHCLYTMSCDTRIESCFFYYSANYSYQNDMVNSNFAQASLKMNKCLFDFKKAATLEKAHLQPKAVYWVREDIIIDDCKFYNLGNKGINVVFDIYFGNNILQITNNDISVNNEFLYCSSIRTNIIFSGNTFRNIQMSPYNNSYFIELQHYLSEINVENNTFSFVNNSGIFWGDILLIILRIGGNEYTVNFINNSFINITNQNGIGGALRWSYETPTFLNFLNCIFRGNRCNSQYGGAIYMNIKRDVLFSNCTFDENYAEQSYPAICIYCENTIIDSVTATFINCQFKNNDSRGNYISYVVYINRGYGLFQNCSFIFDNINNKNGAIDLGSESFCLIDCQFVKTNSNKGLKFSQAYESANVCKIQNCIFDGCYGKSGCKCFDLSFISNSNFVFTDCIIKNLNKKSQTYAGQITLPSLTDFVLENITFLNNECDSLYGGGIGLMIINAEKITFNQCNFSKNMAFQSRESRTANGTTYYNGDGGAFQIGFSPTIYEVDVEFINCYFEENKAYRHGGALALQTVQIVNIFNCTFINNNADAKSSSSMLLNAENHFDKKTEGRGGAIYINPTFVIENQPNIKYMTNVNIKNCTFQSNKAYDGFAIYVEGDNLGTVFSISNNMYIDNGKLNPNDNDIYTIYRAAISSEIFHILYYDYYTNTCINTQNDACNIYCNVDNYGNPIMPTPAKTDIITPSGTPEFSESIYFSNSNLFTSTNEFSMSYSYSKSDYFSKSMLFSRSAWFSKSEELFKSYKFSQNELSQTSIFTKSNIFTKSKSFSYTHVFSRSEVFSETSKFVSQDSFSSSNEFSKSNSFTEIYEMISSTKTSEYEKSTTKIINIQSISETTQFTVSESFSSLLSLLPDKNSLSISLSVTYFLLRSVSYSFSYYNSYTIIVQYNENELSYVASQTIYEGYYPYIIYFLSPSYVPTYIAVLQRKPKITQEQLIGVSCGSASVVFTILGIIILYRNRKRYIKKKIAEYEDWTFSEEEEKKEEKEEIYQVNFSSDESYDFDFWL